MALALLPAATPAYAQAEAPPDLRQDMPGPDAAEATMSEAERQMRLQILKWSMGLGGSPSAAPAPSPSPGRAPDAAQERRQAQERRCAHYSNPSARNACMHGRYWDADDIQYNRSTKSKCAGYGGWQCEKQR
jgi:hypothetical protein